MIMSEEGVVVRTPVEGISELGRSTQGVRVMNVAEDDRVTAVAIAAHGKKKRAANADGAEELDESSIDEMEEYPSSVIRKQKGKPLRKGVAFLLHGHVAVQQRGVWRCEERKEGKRHARTGNMIRLGDSQYPPCFPIRLIPDASFKILERIAASSETNQGDMGLSDSMAA
ncbi:DNA gyrase C-terminal beta-propeller domain-containing protein [uncultured Senegalimassilia sp.]|uniref:DNA gyrase C-terminal beta-propeller domain-containing protein n=1 Tax=uncultured Senegalimassilia sp. TaxID=1714350 RepID=UPI0025CECFBC|nr:DNA gyrase C-terminal beta-propeller domain-containing protein [uncultured Senegalimassilia sp.]